MTRARTRRLHRARVEIRDGFVMPRLSDEERDRITQALRAMGSEWRAIMHCSPECLDLDRRPSDTSPHMASVFARGAT